MFIQPVPPMSIEWTGLPRQAALRVIEWDLREPRVLTKQELRRFKVQPDFAEDEYAEWLEQEWDLNASDMVNFFESGGLLARLTRKNSVDHIAVRFDRGDAILSLSALTLIEKGVGAYDEECDAVVSCASNACVAIIATDYLGGCGETNLLIDFRKDEPVIQELQRHFDCADAIEVLADGRIVLRGYGWGELYLVDMERFVALEIEDNQTRQMAQDLLAGASKSPDGFR